MTRRFYRILFLIFLISGNALFAQTLEEDIEHSVYKYIFKLSNDQALNLYNNGFDEKLLTNLIDSVLYDSVYNPVEVGHYLLIYAKNNYFIYEYVSKDEIFANILENKKDLMIQVSDIDGRIIEDAIVKAHDKLIPFDSKLKCYKEGNIIDEKNIEILYGNHLTIYPLLRTELTNKTSINSHVKKHIPVKKIFIKSRSSNRLNRLSGDIILNKPMYFPGDTLKFKALLWENDKPWSRRKVNVFLSNFSYIKDNEKKFIYKISPYSKGAYSGEIIIRDSLNLALDGGYYLQFLNKNFTARSDYFSIEEYELKNNKIEVLNLHKNYLYCDSVKFSISSFDVNNLPLFDVKTSISVHSLNLIEFDTTHVNVPHLIWTKDTLLSSTGYTNFSIPSSYFPCAKVNYQIIISSKTSDNERNSYTNTFIFNKLKYSSKLSLEDDSIHYAIYKYGKSISKKGILYRKLNKAVVTIDSISTPYSEHIRQNSTKYVFKTRNPFISDSIEFDKSKDVIFIESRMLKDSVNVSIINDYGLFFIYQIYLDNKLIDFGSDSVTLLDLQLKRQKEGFYYVCVQYVWCGKSVSIEKNVPPFNKLLNITLENEVKSYPNLNTELTLRVTNSKGKNVKNANVLAYAVNNKFEKIPIPRIPCFQDATKQREYSNSYTLPIKYSKDKFIKNINYDKWKQFLGLDENQFYHFLYPGKTLFQKAVSVKDTITQFAPFIIRDGQLLPVYIIYIDKNPVYFGNSNTLQSYSFKSDTVIKDLTIRYIFGEVVIKNLKLEKGKKTILSLNIDSCSSSIIDFIPKKEVLDASETSLIKNKTIFINHDKISDWTYITQNGKCYPISFFYRPEMNIVCGPINAGQAIYTQLGKIKQEFLVQPYSLYKIEEFPKLEYTYKDLNFYSPSFYFPRFNLLETIINEDIIRKNWEYNNQDDDISYYNFFNDFSKFNGGGSLFIKTESNSDQVIATMLKSTSETYLFRNYRATVRYLPSENYTVILFFKDSTFIESSEIQISDNYDTYIDIESDAVLSKYNFIQDKYQINKFRNDQQKNIINKSYNHIDNLLSDKYPYRQDPYSSELYNFNTRINYENMKLIRGRVIDGISDEPLIGTSVVEIGTSNSTITDYDGSFSIFVKDTSSFLSFSYIGYKNQTRKIGESAYFYVILNENVKELNEVLRIGYGQRSTDSYYKKFDILSLKETKNEKTSVDQVSMKMMFNELKSMPQAITTRTYFSDYAFWEPRLLSDRDGIVKFNVKMPGNITSWKTFFVAVKEDNTGINQTVLNSFKPVSSDLYLPQFMLIGDTCNILAKNRNYLGDNIDIETSCKIQDSLVLSRTRTLSNIIIDTMSVVAQSSDSININYSLKTSDGYFDGLKQNIPVYNLGTIETKGDFWILDRDTSFSFSFQDSTGEILLYAESDELGTISREVENTLHYEHLCNEQLASKLISLFAKKRIAELMGEEVDIDKNVKFIIKKLLKNRNEDGLWGWWNVSETEFIFSAHVWDALMQAKENGYEVEMDMHLAVSLLLSELGNAKGTDLIYRMELFNRIHPGYDLKSYITKADTMYHYAFADYLRLMRLKQKQGMEYSLDTLFKTMREDMFRGAFWPSGSYYLFGNSMRTTLLAYELIKGKNPKSPTLPKIRRYFLKSRINGYWANTYESASIIENILEDIIDERGKLQSNTLRIKEAGDTLIDKFPYSASLKSGKTLTIQKTGNMPMYLTTYKKQWNPEPERIDKDFEVNSKFTDGELIGGKENILEVTVYCKKEAEFVMIEIPIPAGCSYADKKQNYNELHREYYKNKVCIFLRKMNTGTQVFEVKLVPRYSGKYSLNPAKAELMYFPTFMGRTGMKRVRIE